MESVNNVNNGEQGIVHIENIDISIKNIVCEQCEHGFFKVI